MIHIHEHRYLYLEEINEGILRNIPECDSTGEKEVLDVGCGSGTLSEAIQSKGYTVWGIEADEEAAAGAAKRIKRVINADLTSMPDIEAQLAENVFDYIVFSDVLEHIYDPFLTVKQYLPFLKSGGHLLISVPNAVVWTNRLRVLFGRFDYCDTGVLDRTHIRFFTFNSAKALVSAAGCSIETTDYTPFFTRALLPVIKKLFLKGGAPEGTGRRQLIDSPSYKLYMKYMYPAEYLLGKLSMPLFAFRIIIVGRKS